MHNTPPDPLTRRRITQPISVGVKAIDAMLTTGEGQRVGLFAAAGVGKVYLGEAADRGIRPDKGVKAPRHAGVDGSVSRDNIGVVAGVVRLDAQGTPVPGDDGGVHRQPDGDVVVGGVERGAVQR